MQYSMDDYSCLLYAAIVENLTEVRTEACVDAGQQGVVQWLLKRIRVSYFICILL